MYKQPPSCFAYNMSEICIILIDLIIIFISSPISNAVIKRGTSLVDYFYNKIHYTMINSDQNSNNNNINNTNIVVNIQLPFSCVTNYSVLTLFLKQSISVHLYIKFHVLICSHQFVTFAWSSVHFRFMSVYMISTAITNLSRTYS